MTPIRSRVCLVAILWILSVALVPTSIHGWGQLGHTITGRVAMHLLSNTTRLHIAKILPNVAGDISLVSSWADRVKRLPRYSNTGPLHYSDAHDNPPHSCSYFYNRDCPSGNCVIAAIRNMTMILLTHQNATTAIPSDSIDQSHSNPDLLNLIESRQQRFVQIGNRRKQPAPGTKYSPAEALKFLVHFVQDVHQPLHVSGRERGGNNVHVKFGGKSTNLHRVWDSDILEKAFSENYQESESFFTDTLLSKMWKDWDTELETWATCPTTTPPNLWLPFPVNEPSLAPSINMVMCPEYWAKGVDILNCNNVWPIEDFGPDDDLSGEYYRKNLPVILKNIAMGGLRLAALLEAIFNPEQN